MTYVGAGIPFTVSVVLAVTLGVFKLNNISWRPSRSWARMFVQRLGLSFRHGTKAATKLPIDFDSVKKLFQLRFVFLVSKYNIAPEVVINMDETGMVFFPLPKSSWAPKGAAVVELVAMDEKRQFTVLPAITASGSVLKKTQVIWAGKTDKCEPKQSVKDEYEELLHAHTPSHWSSSSTKESFIDTVYETYVKEQLESGKGTYWLLLLDVHWSNRDKQMLAALRSKYPNLLILFVPANCTSELQPMDVSFNAPFKKTVKTSAAAWLTEEVAEALHMASSPAAVRVTTTKTALIRPFCYWLQNGLRRMAADRALIQRCWRVPGLSQAWEPEPRAQLWSEAAELQSANKLWQVSTKESPLLLTENAAVAAESESSDEEEDEVLQGGSDSEEEKEEERKEQEESAVESVAQLEVEDVSSLRRGFRERRKPQHFDEYE